MDGGGDPRTAVVVAQNARRQLALVNGAKHDGRQLYRQLLMVPWKLGTQIDNILSIYR